MPQIIDDHAHYTDTVIDPDTGQPVSPGGQTADVQAALDGANSPDAGNVFATMADVGGGGPRFLDLGVVAVTDLTADGPATLYTPSGLEFVWLLFGAYVNITSNRIVFEPFSTKAGGDPANPVVYFGTGDLPAPYAEDQLYWSGGIQDTIPSMFFTDAPVVAYFTSGLIAYFTTPAGVWQAEHVYELNDWIIENGEMQAVTTPGTSGEAEPSPWDEAFSTTTDGTVTWTHVGPVATEGEVHVYAMVATPVAP